MAGYGLRHEPTSRLRRSGTPGPARGAARTTLAASAALVGWAAAAMVVGLLAAMAVPRLAGGQSYAVLSDSMAPSVETGDLVVVLPRRAAEIEVGEIVAFADPEGSGRTLQHRVQRVGRAGGAIEVVTMGDANTGHERWRVPAEATVGRVALVIRKAGYLFGPISRPAIRGPATAAAWLALLGLCLLVIWHPRTDRLGGRTAG